MKHQWQRSTWHRATHVGVARRSNMRQTWTLIGTFSCHSMRLAFSMAGRYPKDQCRLVPLEVRKNDEHTECGGAASAGNRQVRA